MNKFILSTLLLLVLSTNAFANWPGDFTVNFRSKGVEVAVDKALREGKTPNDIIIEGLKLTNLNPQNLIKALYCYGAEGDNIKYAANKNGISDIIVLAGAKKAVAECSEARSDSQAYVNFTGAPSPSVSSDRSYASPSTFN